MITLLQEHLDDSSSREPQAAHDHITRVPSSWLIHGYPVCKVFLFFGHRFFASFHLPFLGSVSLNCYIRTSLPSECCGRYTHETVGGSTKLVVTWKARYILESQSISPGSVDFSKTSRQHTCSDTLVFLVNLIASLFASHLYTPWTRQLSGPGPEPYARSKVK